MKHKTRKSIVSIILTICMVIAMTPATSTALADDPGEITSVEVTNITLPSAGKTPEFNGDIPDGAHYHIATEKELEDLGYDKPGCINGIWWYDNDGEMSETDKYEAETTYWFETVLVPDAGYKFAPEVLCKINGDTELVDLDYTEINEDSILISSNDLAFEYEEIETVDVSDIEMPVIGETPDFNGSIPEGANYHFATREELEEFEYGFYSKNINGIWWALDDSFLSESSKFVKDKNYTFGVVLMANEGYKFSEDVECKINGSSASIGEMANNELDLYFDMTDLYAGYKISFDANGGSCDTEYAITQKNKVADLPTPEREGYDFEGWFTEKNGGEKVTTNTVFAENTTVYAQWTEAQALKEITKVDISGITLPVLDETPDFEGILPEGANYHFATREELEAIGYPRIDENINGIWWVGYKGNMQDADKFEADREYYFRAALIPNDGYVFAETVTCTINGKEELNDSTYTKSWVTDFEVYSASFPTELRVTFDANGGNCDEESAITEGGKIKTLPTPEREGYVFDGWFDSNDETGNLVTSETVFTENTTIYARWTESHIHKGEKADAKTPTCTEDGNIEYYVCDCGKWFEDIDCKNEIEDHTSVKKPALGHVFSGEGKWLYDEKVHWHDCERCGAKGTSEAHTFGEDHRCTICGYTEGTTVPTAPSEPSKPTEPVAPPTGDESLIVLWLVLILISAGAGGFTTFAAKGKEK